MTLSEEDAIDLIEKTIVAVQAADEKLLGSMRAALESAQIAQRMVSRLLNIVLFLGLANVILMAALIVQATSR